MKAEDYQSFEYDGKEMLVVPELPIVGECDAVCDFCVNESGHKCCDVPNKAAHGSSLHGNWCGDKDTIYLEKSRFEEYVVEWVRRRIS